MLASLFNDDVYDGGGGGDVSCASGRSSRRLLVSGALHLNAYPGSPLYKDKGSKLLEQHTSENIVRASTTTITLSIFHLYTHTQSDQVSSKKKTRNVVKVIMFLLFQSQNEIDDIGGQLDALRPPGRACEGRPNRGGGSPLGQQPSPSARRSDQVNG